MRYLASSVFVPTKAQNSPAVLKEKILTQKNAASLEQTKALRATLDKRLTELE